MSEDAHSTYQSFRHTVRPCLRRSPPQILEQALQSLQGQDRIFASLVFRPGIAVFGLGYPIDQLGVCFPA